MAKNKKAIFNLTGGLILRIISSVIIITALPFLIMTPTNTIAIVTFAFGNFLIVIGGLMD